MTVFKNSYGISYEPDTSTWRIHASSGEHEQEIDQLDPRTLMNLAIMMARSAIRAASWPSSIYGPNDPMAEHDRLAENALRFALDEPLRQVLPPAPSPVTADCLEMAEDIHAALARTSRRMSDLLAELRSYD